MIENEDKETSMVRKGFIVEGLKSEHSSNIIRKQAMTVDGVKEVEFDSSRHVGFVTFDESKTDIDEILFKIEEKGFKGFILDEINSDKTKAAKETKKSNIVTKEFRAKGTTCNSCAEIIKRQALKVEGVKQADFDYATEKGSVTFDENKTSLKDIFAKIEKKGYECLMR
jgi:Cu+-exporting ATPase